MLTYVLTHLVVLAALAAAAWGAGSIVARRLDCASMAGLVAVRASAGLATLGLVLFALGTAGRASATASAAVVAIAVVAGISRLRDLRGLSREPSSAVIAAALLVSPIFVLSLYPPIAFDETLYHLPTVERFAATGSMPFVDNLRFPVFPHLDELLRVPLMQLGGDVATHLLSFFATLVTVLLLLAWFGERGEKGAGWLAAALFLSAPIVAQLATTGYVEALQTMFVAAAFYAFDRWRGSASIAWLVASGAFAGCSAAVKYPGLFWVAVLFLGVLLKPESRGRNAFVFSCAACLALAPWYGRIVWFTGNPIFPFGAGIFGHSMWDIAPTAPRSLGERALAVARLPWDVLFARERTGLQPPFSPFLVALIPVVIHRALSDRTARVLAMVVALYCAAWAVLPPDARYLEPALPLASAAAALAIGALLPRFSVDAGRALALAAIVVVLPGPLYALHRIHRYGAIPIGQPAREAWLSSQIEAYGAIAFLNPIASGEDAAWLCGGENLAYHFRGEMFGDHSGPARFALITSARDEVELDRRAAALGARYILVVKGQCSNAPLRGTGPAARFTRLYEDPATIVYERRAR